MSVVELIAPDELDQARNVDVETLTRSIRHHLQYTVGVSEAKAKPRDYFRAVAFSIRNHLVDAMRSTEQRQQDADAKHVYYLSMEFLIGKSLESNLLNLGLLQTCRDALQNLGVDIEQLQDSEPDAGLGNGGLGRLAACFIDSMASIGLAGSGYGINYEFGLFKQEIKNGWQYERPDNWLTYGTPWQIERPDEAVVVPLYGHIEYMEDRDGERHPMWVGWKAMIGVPHDMPVVGYGGRTVNKLRLFSAQGSNEFDMAVFNEGDYIKAVEEKIRAETISKVLYPSDAVAEGRELRLIQEYFMVACCVRDAVRRHEAQYGDIRSLAEHNAIQLNDTHPALAVAELMRVLTDEKELEWEEAWKITTATLAYTNHTLLPEALEKWPVDLINRVLPRHMLIIYEINHRFLEDVKQRWPDDADRVRAMSLIQDGPEQQLRMCNLAIVGSHSVNGVSALHSQLVQSQLVPYFHDMMPEKFNNKTNGITQRRWLLQCNPDLAQQITRSVGDGWITDLDQLRALEPFAKDTHFQDQFLAAKTHNKQRLAEIIQRLTGENVDPQSMYDVQVKRIHQYKRQLLAALRIVREYLAIVEDGVLPACPRTYIFAGKAAPGYWTAKQIIGLITHIGKVVNSDSRVQDWMRVVFLPNYRVSLAERIFPASDLSEQISTAGFEASGTGNMKFMLNGALTMGTLDGANVEMREEAGDENFFIFGKTTEQIKQWYDQGGETAQDIYDRSPEIQRLINEIGGTRFSPNQPGLFSWVHDLLVKNHDPYFHLADLDSYSETQHAAGQLYADRAAWAEKAIMNVARAGKFSSDRTIRQYAEDIWNSQPVE